MSVLISEQREIPVFYQAAGRIQLSKRLIVGKDYAAGKVLAGKSVIFAFCGVVGSKRKNASPQPFMKKLVIDFLKKWQ